MTESLASAEREDKPRGAQCTDCGAALGTSTRFCPSCGVMQRAPRLTPERAERDAAADPADGPVCATCGEAVDADKSGFCRGCGQVLKERELGFATHVGARTGRAARKPGQCHSCGADLPTGQKFCARCGTASRLARISPSDLVVQDPGWYKVVKGLGLVFEGHLTLVISAISATAVVTVLSLFASSWSQLTTVRAALLGAATLAGVVGLVLAVVGEAICLAAPAESKVRLPTLVTLAIGGVSATLGVVALILMGAVGFDPSRMPAVAMQLASASLLLFIARLVAFSTLLRRVAFALQHYRIAQGSVGFIVFIGVGLLVVGLINLLFQSARPAAQTFAQLLAVAFALGVAFWYLNIVKRGRDLVRQRLP